MEQSNVSELVAPLWKWSVFETLPSVQMLWVGSDYIQQTTSVDFHIKVEITLNFWFNFIDKEKKLWRILPYEKKRLEITLL